MKFLYLAVLYQKKDRCYWILRGKLNAVLLIHSKEAAVERGHMDGIQVSFPRKDKRQGHFWMDNSHRAHMAGEELLLGENRIL